MGKCSTLKVVHDWAMRKLGSATKATKTKENPS